MILSHFLPAANMFLTHHHHHLLKLSLFSKSLKPNKTHLTKSLLSPKTSTNPISHFSISSSSPLLFPQTQENQQNQENTQNHQVLLPIEKLFVPPETVISTSIENPPRVLKGSNIVLSKYAAGAHVDVAEFVKSSVGFEDCPGNGEPEFALVGRSNVGKSSLLNSLVRRKKLALTSKKPALDLRIVLESREPEFALVGRSTVGRSSLLNSRKKVTLTFKKRGKTQCINHFRINDSWYLVDLPGYGYASAPHELRIDWDKFTKDYFLNRPTLVSVFLLIDASIPAKKIDLEYASWLGQNQIPMTLVFTKCDKRKKKKNGGKRPEENVQDFQDLISDFFQSVPPWIMTSSVTNQGRDEILLHMAQLRNYWLKH